MKYASVHVPIPVALSGVRLRAKEVPQGPVKEVAVRDALLRDALQDDFVDLPPTRHRIVVIVID